MRVWIITTVVLLAVAAYASEDKPLVIVRDHHGKGKIYSVAFSPDGKKLASAEIRFGDTPGTGDVVALRDLATNQETLLPHDGLIQSVVFSPDGRIIATGSAVNSGATKPARDAFDPGVITLWSSDTAAKVAVLSGHDKAVVCVRFSPDGKLLASADLFGAIKVWDVTKRELLRSFGGDGAKVLFGFDMAFSPDAGTLATAGGKFVGVRLWDVGSGKIKSEINEDLHVNSPAYSPDGKRLAYNMHSTGAGKGIFIRAVDVDGRGEPLLIDGSFVECLRFSPDGKRLAVGRGASFRDVVLWDLVTKKAWLWPESPALSSSPVTAIAFSGDGSKVAAVRGGQLMLWDVRTADGPRDEPYRN